MTTLATLQASVDAWLIRDDVAVTGTDWPVILLLAEAQIAREVRCGVQEKQTTLNFTGRSAVLPSNFLEVRNPFIDDATRRMDYMTPEAIRRSDAWQNGRVGSFYTIEGEASGTPPDDRMQVTIAGPASVASPLSMTVNYYARFDPLVDGGDTNWLLTNHFDVYLYATLRAAAEYIQEDVLEDRFSAKFIGAVESLNIHENRKRFGAMPKHASNSPRTVV